MPGGGLVVEWCWPAAVLLGSANADSKPSRVLEESAGACPVPCLRSATATSADTATRAASCTHSTCSGAPVSIAQRCGLLSLQTQFYRQIDSIIKNLVTDGQVRAICALLGFAQRIWADLADVAAGLLLFAVWVQRSCSQGQ